MLDDIYSDPWGNDPPPGYPREPEPDLPPYVPPPMAPPPSTEQRGTDQNQDNTHGAGNSGGDTINPWYDPSKEPSWDPGRVHGYRWVWNAGKQRPDGSGVGMWEIRDANGGDGTVIGPSTGGGQTQPSGFGDTSGFAWPRFNAPQYTPIAPFVAPPAFEFAPFSYEDFKAPQFSDIYNDGSFIGRQQEGMKAIENSAAAKGLTRLPATLKALAGWNQDFASREYGNIFDRAAGTYDRNRGNAFSNWQANRNNAADNYSLNYGIARDVWDRNDRQNTDTYDRNYKSAFDTFNYNDFQPAKYTFDDMYRRWKDQLDATTSIATAGANL
jgi:hypothetical protein